VVHEARDVGEGSGRNRRERYGRIRIGVGRTVGKQGGEEGRL
jgi:hypothetical protein